MSRITLGLALLLGAGLMTNTHMAAAAGQSPLRPYLIGAGGVGLVLASPFIYDFLYYKVASREKLNHDAQELINRVRARYNIEGLLAVYKQNEETKIKSYVAKFFACRHDHESGIRRWCLFAPEYSEEQYFLWRTRPFLHQLDCYSRAVNDYRLSRELDALHTALKTIYSRVQALAG